MKLVFLNFLLFQHIKAANLGRNTYKHQDLEEWYELFVEIHQSASAVGNDKFTESDTSFQFTKSMLDSVLPLG